MSRIGPRKLIVHKTGESETFIDDNSEIVSLGDIVRTRILLGSKYRDHIYWCTSSSGKKLLQYDIGTKFLDWNEALQECSTNGHLYILNLEKNVEKFKMIKKTNASCLGLIFDESRWKVKNINNEVFEIKEWKSKYNQIWSNMLLGLIENEDLSKIEMPRLDPPFKEKDIYRFGLNHLVGSKWKNKTFSNVFWSKISDFLGTENVSWQQGEKNLEDYMNWIYSCETIITHDSLGLHLGVALGKNIIALYRSTTPHDILWKKNDRYYILDNNSSEEKILELIKNEFK
jgi:heptosyltransferase-2